MNKFLSHIPAVLNPKGTIAADERQLIVTATMLMLLIVVPVLVLTFVIAWRYRAGNTKATYAPDWDRSRKLETIWWLIPSALIVGLSVITWQSSHALDPSKPLASSVQPLKIQVVALQWKWLFIYPKQNIASVNFVELPVGTPVEFEITSDAPMNSFWIPQLGGQIYAMSGMSTHLHLRADAAGDYTGSSANLSGRGFAGMHFVARAEAPADFDNWVRSVKHSAPPLTFTSYEALARPSENQAPSPYSATPAGLYDEVVMQYMMPNATLTPASAP
ncbi:MAG TPA: ubiquinol oxidase subunit II [Candidatus Saccharimonadia bacterium]|nr:ubiquinol oxidase subunit II [Candidatus Saccharimonadia bacterium]